MDVKVAKYFPIELAGLAVLRELFLFVFHYHLNPSHFILGVYIDFWSVLSLFSFFLKVAFILGALYLYKLYSQSNLKQVKVLAGALIGLYFFQNIVGWHESGYYRIPGLFFILQFFVFLVLVANVVIAFVAKDPKAPQTPKVMRQPNFYQQPQQQVFQTPQQVTVPNGQSIPDQLAALQVLVDNGTLTPAEFQAAKQRIIGG